VIWRLLHLRRERPGTFGNGAYAALQTEGPRGENIVAFARDDIVVAVPRLARRLLERADGPPRLAFGDERIRLAPDAATRYVDRFTGAVVEAESSEGNLSLPAREVFAAFPAAVLVPADA
jgi:(1->4)-alpha-D-glucan 1-alpha-D-glucosylmutase